MFGRRESHGIFEQRPERPAEPVVRGNVKTDLLSIEDRRGEFAAHQVPQNHLLAGTLDFHAGRERVGELHNPMIQERRPHFHRMRHAGVIHLGEDIVRKKILLIEPEIILQMFASQVVQHGIERGRQRRLDQRAPVPIVERSAPVHMRARRGHPAAFEETLQLVFEADFIVGHRPASRDRKQRAERRTRQSAGGMRQQAGALHQVSAEQFICPFAAQRNRCIRLGKA